MNRKEIDKMREIKSKTLMQKIRNERRRLGTEIFKLMNAISKNNLTVSLLKEELKANEKSMEKFSVPKLKTYKYKIEYFCKETEIFEEKEKEFRIELFSLAGNLYSL